MVVSLAHLSFLQAEVVIPPDECPSIEYVSLFKYYHVVFDDGFYYLSKEGQFGTNGIWNLAAGTIDAKSPQEAYSYFREHFATLTTTPAVDYDSKTDNWVCYYNMPDGLTAKTWYFHEVG